MEQTESTASELPQLYWIERAAPGRLATMAGLAGGEDLAAQGRALRAAGVDLVVSLLDSAEAAQLGLDEEAAELERAGVGFVSLPVGELDVPTSIDETLEAAQALAGDLQGGKAVAIHCRLGTGRAALIASVVLVVEGDSPAQAFRRVKQARGVDVPDLPAQRHWLERFAEQWRKRQPLSL